ncbi:MAG: monovalent cation/H(+) antiporter subunit G [Blautia sp.]|nr:monovalent cation/H(+) antiporter subunit G [Blautia sp.]
MMEWIRFFIVASLLAFALVSFAAAVKGAWSFGFVMNRMHAAGVGDTLGLFCVVLAMIIARGPAMESLKLLLLVVFLWSTSPVSSHFLIQIEYFTNPNLYSMAEREETEEDRKGGES